MRTQAVPDGIRHRPPGLLCGVPGAGLRVAVDWTYIIAGAVSCTAAAIVRLSFLRFRYKSQKNAFDNAWGSRVKEVTIGNFRTKLTFETASPNTRLIVIDDRCGETRAREFAALGDGPGEIPWQRVAMPPNPAFGQDRRRMIGAARAALRNRSMYGTAGPETENR
jgi:hypothetical protein